MPYTLLIPCPWTTAQDPCESQELQAHQYNQSLCLQADSQSSAGVAPVAVFKCVSVYKWYWTWTSCFTGTARNWLLSCAGFSSLRHWRSKGSGIPMGSWASLLPFHFWQYQGTCINRDARRCKWKNTSVFGIGATNVGKLFRKDTEEEDDSGKYHNCGWRVKNYLGNSVNVTSKKKCAGMN